MDWNKLYGSDCQPSYDDIVKFIGSENRLYWNKLFEHMEKNYQVEPRMAYTRYAVKPGWNVNFQKDGVSFGTLYPEENGFSVFMIIGYKLLPTIQAIKDKLSPDMQERIDNAQDYMKVGKWIMFRIEKEKDLEDYKLLIAEKAAMK